MSGSNWVAQNDTNFGWNKKARMYEKRKTRNLTYKYTGNCNRFFNDDKFDLKSVSPKNDLTSNGTCFAQAGKTYVTYCQNGDPIRLNTTDPPSPIRYTWFDPNSSKYEKPHILQVDKTMSFTPPNSQDWVLLVEASK